MVSALPYQTPSAEFWLGTDALGSSVAIRLLIATWETLYTVAAAAAIAAVLGTLVGAALAFSGQSRLRALCETLLGFAYAAPLLLLVLLLVVVYGDRPWVFPSVGILAWGGIALSAATSLERIINSGFVRASRALGATPLAAYLRHGIPHALPTVASATAALSAQLFQLSVLLAFIGVGRSGLGNLICEGYEVYPTVWWTWLPATLVAALILSGSAWLAQRGGRYG